MKKVLLVLSVAMAAVVMTSCFGRECVCKTTVKVDGEKVSKGKSIDFEEKCNKTGKWTETEKNPLNGKEYEYNYNCK